MPLLTTDAASSAVTARPIQSFITPIYRSYPSGLFSPPRVQPRCIRLTHRKLKTLGTGGLDMNKDETEGRGNQIKGNLKQAAGKMLNDEKLHDEGVADEAAGDVQEGFGKGRRKVGEALNDLGDKLKR